MSSSISTIIFSELLGTSVLVFLGNGVITNLNLNSSKAKASDWINIATGWGIAIVISLIVTLFGEAHLNPAATIAIYFWGFAKKLNQMAFFSMLLHIIFQFIGAILGQFFLYLIFYFHYQSTSDEIKILETFSTVPSVRNKFVCFLTEFFGTFILLLVFFSLKESNLVINGNISTRILEIFILGMTVWGLVLSIGGITGCALNPARDLGPRILFFFLFSFKKENTKYINSQWMYSWIPVSAPILGGIFAAIFSLLLF